MAIILIFLVLALSVSFYAGQSNIKKDTALVVEVLDGDTIVVSKGNRNLTVRLLGIDTPETHHPTKPVQCYGPEASEYTKTLLEGKSVYLEYDIEHYDKYSRTLAYVYIGKTMINRHLIEKGYARLLTIYPNKKYAHQLLEAELKAKSSSLGLWKNC